MRTTQESPQVQRARRKAAALEARDHNLTVAAWAWLLARLLPSEYRERPLPHRPALVLSREARILVYRRRAAARRALFHPLDLVKNLELLGLRAPAGELLR